MKAETNVYKHGVSFEQAVLACEDELALVEPDALFPERDNIIGMSGRKVLFVVTVERGERTRIISARKATPAQQRAYEEG